MDAELIKRMEPHVHSCYFSPLTAEKVAARLLFLVDQSKHGLAALTQTTVASETQRRVWLSQIMPLFPPGNPIILMLHKDTEQHKAVGQNGLSEWSLIQLLHFSL